jgi:hypothetical protein
MGRGQRQLSTARVIAAPRLRTGTRVSLFGGPADGRVVKVQFLDDRIAVYDTRAGDLVVLASDAPPVDGRHLGIYEFVGPRGPDRPVFVHRLSARAGR